MQPAPLVWPDRLAICAVAKPFVKGREGLRLKPYPDSGGVPTIGWGSTRYLDGRKVQLTDPAIRPDLAEVMLTVQLMAVIDDIHDDETRIPTVNQAAAIASLAYNCGEPAIAKSTLIRLFNAGDIAGAADQFLRWDHVREHGVLVEDAGLLARRKLERALFLTPDNGPLLEPSIAA